MKCPKCGGLTVGFFGAVANDPSERIGIRCDQTKIGSCNWKITMKDVMDQLEELKRECRVIANHVIESPVHCGLRRVGFGINQRRYQIVRSWLETDKVPSPGCSSQTSLEERITELERRLNGLTNANA